MRIKPRDDARGSTVNLIWRVGMDSAISQQSIKEESGLSASSRSTLYSLGGVAAWLKLGVLLAYMVVAAVYGPRPTSATEFFAYQQESTLKALLTGDFLFLVMFAMYLVTFPALFIALRRINPTGALLATLATIVAVTLGFANESTLAMLHLGEQYANATTTAQQAPYLAAGEAVMAAGWWTSSASYMTGILLQGGGVIISLIMWRSPAFSKLTAASGLLGNGLDLIQHVIHPFAPMLSETIKLGMGIFYLIWFPMLGRDLLRLGRENRHSQLQA